MTDKCNGIFLYEIDERFSDELKARLRRWNVWAAAASRRGDGGKAQAESEMDNLIQPLRDAVYLAEQARLSREKIARGRCWECNSEIRKSETMVVVQLRGGNQLPNGIREAICVACAKKVGVVFYDQERGVCPICARPLVFKHGPYRYNWDGKVIAYNPTCSTQGRIECYRQWRNLNRRVEREHKHCEMCGEEFEPARKDARYCSNACRQKAHRRRCIDVMKADNAPATISLGWDGEIKPHKRGGCAPPGRADKKGGLA